MRQGIKEKHFCKNCQGSGIRKEAHYVKINKKSILDIVMNSIESNLKFFKNLKLQKRDKLSERPLKEIISRLEYIDNIGLGYLTLQRKTNSLSGGVSKNKTGNLNRKARWFSIRS